LKRGEDPESAYLYVVQAQTRHTARTGYPAFVRDRHFILQTLYHHLWNKEKVLLNKRAQHVEHSRDCVKGICKDGTQYVGHIVVGSDGVNSVIRKEMWHLSDLEKPGRIPHTKSVSVLVEFRD
jgi:FAD dependent monooxygenase